MSTTQNVMPARAIPPGPDVEAAQPRSHLVLASGPGVGASTHAQVIASRPATAGRRARTVTVADGGRAAGGVGGDRSSGPRASQAFDEAVEGLAEGAIVDVPSTAVDRLFAEAEATKLGRYLAKLDVTAHVVASPAVASARRASAILARLAEQADDLGVKRVVLVLVDTIGGSAWDSKAHADLRREAASAGAAVVAVPTGDLELVEEIGFAEFKKMSDSDLSAKLGVSLMKAGGAINRHNNWLTATDKVLQAAEASVRPKAKAG